ncbi:MAG: cell division protein FtsQ [Cycloclasticus sp.]|nr:MAG: cell division protein FtsQ [Cycloclasticus sp.]
MKNANTDTMKPSKAFAVPTILLLLIGLSIWQLLQWMGQPNTMPIKHVRIEGEMKHIPQEDISNALAVLVQTGYFAVDSDAIINKLTDLQWIREARIRRVWPDTLVVSIEEQNPVAVWNKTQLLNVQGEVFKPMLNMQIFRLPYFSGVNSESKQILTVQKNLNVLMTELALSVQELKLAEHGSWSVVLSNGLKINAGKQSPERKIIKSLNALASQEGELIEHAKMMDLRYPNGVSVMWKKGYVVGQPNERMRSLVIKNNKPTKG